MNRILLAAVALAVAAPAYAWESYQDGYYQGYHAGHPGMFIEPLPGIQPLPSIDGRTPYQQGIERGFNQGQRDYNDE